MDEYRAYVGLDVHKDTNRLDGPETAVRPICDALPTREGKEQGGHSDRARARGLHLGHCPRGAEQASPHPGDRLS